jgi:hypothetical protein
MTKPKAEKDKRVAFEVPAEIAADFESVRKTLKTTKGGLGATAARFVIPLLKQGKLVSLNGEIVPADQALESLRSRQAERAAA